MTNFVDAWERNEREGLGTGGDYGIV